MTTPALPCRDTFRQYLNDINDYPPLGNEQEDALMLHMQRTPDRQEAAALGEQLVMGSLRLVVYLANVYYQHIRASHNGYCPVPLEDMIQEGNLTVIECVDRLQEGKHCEDYSAYISASIRYALIGAYHASSPVYFSGHEREKAIKEGTYGKARQAKSLDTPFAEDDDRTLLDEIVALPQALPDQEHSFQQGNALLASLPEKERRIMQLRYGLDEEDQREHTLREVAEKMGVSEQTCLNIENKVLRALNEGVPLRTSSEFYTFTEACTVLAISRTAFIEKVKRGVICRYLLSSHDQQGVYRKEEIDTLAYEYWSIQQHYYTAQETAERLGLTYECIKQWARQGKLTRQQLPGRDNYGGLFAKAEIDRIAQEREEAHRLYYECQGAATRLGISPAQLNKWVHDGWIQRYTHAGLDKGGYLKEEVNRILEEKARLARDYYTTEQAACLFDLTANGFSLWAQRAGLMPARKSWDGVKDLYEKQAVDRWVEEIADIKRTTYSRDEVMLFLGIAQTTLSLWVQKGIIAPVQLPGRGNYGCRYLKQEINRLRFQARHSEERELVAVS
jgi:RNA polymerase sporulation-specific sigma factor